MTERKRFFDKLTERLRDKRWPVLAAMCLGLILLILPSPKNKNVQQVTEQAEHDKEDERRGLAQTEEMLSKLLSSIEGAGEVKVMLSYEQQDSAVYACDTNADECKTVVITIGSQKQQAVVASTKCASYRGAVVLAQGADSAAVRLMITQAVSAITGLGADSISVLKMK